jgi:hypothetical protein
MAPRSQNLKAPIKGAMARDGSPFIRPQIDPLKESLEVELLV